jgi:hypothetical protein
VIRVPVGRDCGTEKSVMMSLSFLFAGMVFVSAIRRHKPSECEATRQPHSSMRCLVELVRTDVTEEVGDTPNLNQETAGRIRA